MSNNSKKEPFNYAKLYRRTGLILYDIISVIAASYVAFLIRYEFSIASIPEHFMTPVNRFLPINIVLTLIIFYLFRLYNSLWAYAGERELQNLVMACVLSGIVNAVGLQFFKSDVQPVPQSYYFLYTFLLITLIFVSRFSYRVLRTQKHLAENKNNSKAVMIIGAGEAGSVIIKEINTSDFSTMSIKCIIDDDVEIAPSLAIFISFFATSRDVEGGVRTKKERTIKAVIRFWIGA